MAPVEQQVVAVVLAGAGREDAVARRAGVSSKAHLPIAGKPMVSYVLAALCASNSVAATVFVGDEPEVPFESAVKFVPSGLSYTQSLALGIGGALATLPAAPVLVVTADVPWLEPAAIDRFVAAAGDAQIAYPVVTREVAVEAFPNQLRTFVKLKQGQFTGGNLLFIRRAVVAPVLELIERFYTARKNPLAMASLVGPGTLAALLLGRADITRLERIVSTRLGGEAKAIITEDACLAADIDSEEQLAGAPVPVLAR